MNNAKKQLTLYRKRYFPQEIICLKDDIILYAKENLIISKWNTLKPRSDIAGGISAYVIDKNIKISKVFDASNNFVHWYCDIITTECQEDSAYIFTDLLIDIIIDSDGIVHVVDMDELGDYIKNGTIDPDTACLALHAANDLLNSITNGDFKQYQKLLSSYKY